ncbi:MAG: hypothetical protein IT307_08245 [Chloroflexi bacterium]|nr:hypothetical protein [Chloroflexota bacterium]
MAILNPPNSTGQPPASAPTQGGLDAAQAARARRRAWTIILGAFAIWTGLVASGVYKVDVYRRTAVVPVAAEVLSVRGIPLYTSPSDGRSEIRLKDGALIEELGHVEVPQASELVLRLLNGGTARLLSGADLRLAQHHQGKFDPGLTSIELDLNAGAAIITAPEPLPSDRPLLVHTSLGTLSLTPGEYLVWAQEAETRASVYSGLATVDQTSGPTIQVADRQRVELPAKEASRQPRDITEDLVANGTFRELDFDDVSPPPRREPVRRIEIPPLCDKQGDKTIDILKSWCVFSRGEPGRPDTGGRVFVIDQSSTGLPSNIVRISRTTTKNFHNQTGLEQRIDRDVTPYRQIVLSGWIKINFQSLTGGGFRGSEYPLMLSVEYITENGGRPTWERGFYYGDPAGNPVDSPVEGQQLRQGEWEHFSFDLRSLGEQPSRITKVTVSASGWDFDAEVANVDLTVE